MRYWLVFIALCLIWGSTWAAIRLGLEDSLPLWSSAVRFLIAGAFFVVLRLLTAGWSFPAARFGLASAYGILYFCIPFGIVYWAEQHVPTGLIAVLAATAPVMILLGERAFYGAALTAAQVVGAGLSFVGVALLFYGEIRLSLSAEYVIGLVASWIGMAALAAATLLVRPHVRNLSSVELNGAAMLIGGAVLAVASLLLESGPRGFHGQNLAALLYLAFVGSAFAFWSYLKLIAAWGAGRSSTTLFVAPAVALYLGAWLFDERLTPTSYVGTGLIILGIMLINLSKLAAERRAAAARA